MPFFKVLLRREVVEEVQIFVEADDDAALRETLNANLEREITHADNCECWEGDTARASVEAFAPVDAEDTRGYVLNLTK